MTGVLRTLEVNVERMAAGLDAGYTQATDLSEFIVQTCGVDYRSAYDVVGRTVREASRQGIAGRHITGAMLDEAATVVTGAPWGLTGSDLTAALDPRLIIESRRGKGGAAPGAVDAMLQQCEQKVEHLSAAVAERQARLADAQQRLLDDARSTLGDREEA